MGTISRTTEAKRGMLFLLIMKNSKNVDIFNIL